MFRIPMHEPWPSHENKDPLSFKPELTDREQAGGGEDGAPAGGDVGGADEEPPEEA
jgi:hypothetical protein